MAKILVTGAAGFIGYHVSRALAARGDVVVGVDNLNDYYDVGLKKARLAELESQRGFAFERLDIGSRGEMAGLFERGGFESVVHLAAQVGVRYSVENPAAYVESNLVGFANILEGCRHARVKHLVYASSSSVYGANTKLPFAVADHADHPVSLYAATKRANELMAHSYSAMYGLAATGLRFFTVYGPWGRPDMAMFLFTKAILEGRPIDVFNHGRMRRDFTYIDDIVEGVVRVLDRPPGEVRPAASTADERPNPGRSASPYRLYNIGNHRPVELLYLIELLEKALGRAAERRLLPMQPGDLIATAAEVSDLEEATGFLPKTPIEVGVPRFVQWYRKYYS